MDFRFEETQTEIVALAARIMGDRATPELLREVEAERHHFDPILWSSLADADLLGLCLPEVNGGGGYGAVEAMLLCQELGRAAVAVPLLSTLMLGAMPLARHASPAQLDRILPAVIRGDLVLTAALCEGHSALPPAIPTVTAARLGDRWRLTGTKVLVPSVHLADVVPVLMLVPAATDEGTKVFLVSAPELAPGTDDLAGGESLVRVASQVGTDLEPLSSVELDVVVDGDSLIEADGDAVVASIVEFGVVGVCARQAGSCDAALRVAASYTSEREQFGSKLATFQAVAHRLADAYIDTEAIRLTTLAAAWQIDEGLMAGEALAVAKLWSTEGAQRVVHAAQHVHGGIGMDIDYPVHRYFRAVKAGEHFLGTAHPYLLQLGRSIVTNVS